MRRILTATILPLALGLVLAQPPEDYQIVCDVDGEITVIGVVSLVDGELHAAVQEEWSCEGVVAVTGDDGLTVMVDEEDGTVTVSFAPGEGEETVSAEAEALPRVAIEGMRTAQQNRERAMERRAEAHEKAEQAREAAGEAGPPESLPDRPETPEEPEEPEAPEAPELPEPAQNAGDDDARPEGVGEGRP
jgi:hypothetical protein